MPQKDFEKLTKSEKACLKHMLTGQIRNVLANEFALGKGMIGQNAVRAVVAARADDAIRAEVRSRIPTGNAIDGLVKKAIESMVRTEVRKAVTEVIKKHLSDRMEEAAERISFNISVDEQPETKNSEFGRF